MASASNFSVGLDVSTPVLVLGGGQNALSVIRSIGRAGGNVSACTQNPYVARSRYLKRSFPLARGVNSQSQFGSLLLGENTNFDGAVIFACGDDAVEFVARERAALEKRYLLEKNDPHLQLAMLDKLRTLEMAHALGIPTPKVWRASNPSDVADLADAMSFPVIIKPLDTFSFRAIYGRSYLRANSASELIQLAADAYGHGIDFMISELIPGPDDRACSCYTYITETGSELLTLTKRCIRRFPNNVGGGTFQITEHLPDVEDMGMRFFRGVGWKGIGNLEFKRDPRDGSLKVIECNARFTAVQQELVVAGADMALLSYRDITGQPVSRISETKQYVAMWSPRSDFLAFREYRKSSGAGYLDWVKSLACRRICFPYFSWNDLGPSLVSTYDAFRRDLRSLKRRFQRVVGHRVMREDPK